MNAAPKRGMAMVVVMVLLAVMALLASNMTVRLQKQLALAHHQQDYRQAQWYVASAESLALATLSESLGHESRVHLAQSWVQERRSFPVPDGQITINLSDMQACFNLNSLAAVKANRQGTPLVIRQLIALFATADISEYRAQMVAESLWEFIDEDTVTQTLLGREDSEYLVRPIPFLTPNRPLSDLSEIRRVQGMDADLYQKIKPLVCVLPVTSQHINVNTLDIAQSALLEALFTPTLSVDQAREVLKARPVNGWDSVTDFLSETALSDVDEGIKAQVKPMLSVSSNYFHLQSYIEVNGMSLSIQSMIVRQGEQNFEILWHQTGDVE